MRKPLHLTIYSEFEWDELEKCDELSGTFYIEPLDLISEHEEESSEALLKSWIDIKEFVRSETNLSKVAYAAWLKPLDVVKLEGSTVYLSKPNNGMAEYIERKFFHILW